MRSIDHTNVYRYTGCRLAAGSQLISSMGPGHASRISMIWVALNWPFQPYVCTRSCLCHACRSVLTGAQLLAEGLSDRGGFATGFDWAAEQLRQAGLHKVAAEVRGTSAITIGQIISA